MGRIVIRNTLVLCSEHGDSCHSSRSAGGKTSWVCGECRAGRWI